MSITKKIGTKSGKPKAARQSSSQRKWAFGFIFAAVAIWIFYTYIMTHLPEGMQTIVQNWFPPTALNEAMVWVIAALG